MNPRDVEDHLRAASDAIMLLLGEVEQLEGHKRGVLPGDARFEELAKEVRETAQRLADLTSDEEKWARDATLAQSQVATIANSEAPAHLAPILDRWREIERQLNAAQPGSPEAAQLFGEFQRVRKEYMAAFRQRETDL